MTSSTAMRTTACRAGSPSCARRSSCCTRPSWRCAGMRPFPCCAHRCAGWARSTPSSWRCRRTSTTTAASRRIAQRTRRAGGAVVLGRAGARAAVPADGAHRIVSRLPHGLSRQRAGPRARAHRRAGARHRLPGCPPRLPVRDARSAQTAPRLRSRSPGTAPRPERRLSTDPRATLHGEAWPAFLASSRATVGSESGSSAIDRDGSLARTLRRLEREQPGLRSQRPQRRCRRAGTATPSERSAHGTSKRQPPAPRSCSCAGSTAACSSPGSTTSRSSPTSPTSARRWSAYAITPSCRHRRPGLRRHRRVGPLYVREPRRDDRRGSRAARGGSRPAPAAAGARVNLPERPLRG